MNLQLQPGETKMVPVVVQETGNLVPSNPLNAIQIALKTQLGIVYFQTLLPLFCLFSPLQVPSASALYQNMTHFSPIPGINVSKLLANGCSLMDVE
jgi:hypothetical protein